MPPPPSEPGKGRGIVTEAVCEEDHEAVVACHHHNRRHAPLDSLLRGDTWAADMAAGGASAPGTLEREALLPCSRAISFEAAVPGCVPEWSASQVHRLTSGRLHSLTEHCRDDSLSPQAALTGRTSSSSDSFRHHVSALSFFALLCFIPSSHPTLYKPSPSCFGRAVNRRNLGELLSWKISTPNGVQPLHRHYCPALLFSAAVILPSRQHQQWQYRSRNCPFTAF